MSIKFLKVKIKSLAAEAKIIRLEEKRSSGDVRNSLHNHRVIEVRDESRCALIAYAFLRNKRPPSLLKRQGDMKRVMTLASKYGLLKVTTDQINSWMYPQFLSPVVSRENVPAFNPAS